MQAIIYLVQMKLMEFGRKSDLLMSKSFLAFITSKLLRVTWQFGADIIIDASQVEDVAYEIKMATNKRGADIAIEVSGNAHALNQAIRSVVYDGNVVVLSWYPDTLEAVRPGGEFHHNRVKLIESQVDGINTALSNR